MAGQVKIAEGYDRTDKTYGLFTGRGEYTIGIRTSSGTVEHVEIARDTNDARRRVRRLVREDQEFVEGPIGSGDIAWQEVFALDHTGRVFLSVDPRSDNG